ncbi:hypothetical protein E0H82_02330 [Acinetobacter sp. ANC 4910]|uniref:hypothetical protein n=1 Tax=Acinetobacter sp. ANC 4910 TaxID=2529850 RepID=UPI00103BD7B8|nr:hypothetical protein [Acinetobacter sp. ANC 4910]TCB37465.1 hypothetical protein E0H82_02330 [Acinetobacter sp. ANC 4910]
MNFLKFLITAGCIFLLSPMTFAMDDYNGSSMDMAMHSSHSANDKKAMMSAMSAAPMNVSAEATIMAMDTNGKMRILRKGQNNFTCMPDNPATPGPDPMCMDPTALAWAEAWIGHKKPVEGEIGFMYMLMGGTDASNVDPYATKPTANNHWLQTGPHVMIVGASQSFYDMYPKSAQPDTTVPYIMWSGTPYQHLMIPVK